MFFFTRCGSFNPTTGEAVVYSDNNKSRQNLNSEADLEYLGVITAVNDAVVSDYSIANPKYKGVVDVNKNIVSFSNKSADVCVKIDSLLIRPSDAIERIVRRSAVDLKRHYNRFLNNPAKNASSFIEALNANSQTASTVGVTVRTDDDDKRYTFYNKKASMGFNIFNSHPLSIEAHTDADVMILMAIFLKQNSLWHNKGGLLYDQFDYAKMFFRRDKTTDTPFFVNELASCIPVSELDDKTKKRKSVVEEATNKSSAITLIGWQSTSGRCRHNPTASYINLYSNGRQPYCVSCFCSMFFVANGTVMFKDKKGLQEWIDEANERSTDARLVEHLNALSYIECSSKIEHDYKFWNLINSLDIRRKKLLPVMDTDLLFANMNPFGKMLLVMMQNCFIVTEKGKVEGKWFDLEYMGPNLWRFQITSCREEKFDTFVDMACVETLRRLPMEGEPIVSRMVFKTYCRGENLSSAYEVVSDVAQTINNMRMNIEGRKFFFEDGKLCSSAEASDEVLLSLEVTGYRPNRAQNNMNSNRVSARVMRILGSREGARAWKKRGAEKEEDCILIEDLSPSNENASHEAMERMSNLNKIFYYDIETNTNKCSASDAIITSICGSLCTGGDVNGGERVIFALSASVRPEDLVQCIREEYSCQGDMIIDYPPEKIYAFSTEYDLLLAFSEYMREVTPHVLCGWNSKSFDDPFVFYRMVHHLKNDKDPKKRVALASKNGLFNFEPFMTTKECHEGPVLCEAFYGDVSAAAAAHDTMSYMDHQRRKGQGGGGIDINAILGGCCKTARLDMKEVCAKAYENLEEYNLNAVLVKVSKVGDKMAILKDPIDVVKQLLGYLSLKTAKEQAPVHKYCSKDAYAVGIVDISTNKGGEMRRLCYDSTLIESVVMANMPTPLCISDGAICRSMGHKRALKKGSGIRKHSMATETKGGMVSQPIVDSVCLQTVDMSSLYPSTMCQYNLCTSTFVTHMQVINLRDRVAMEYLASDGPDDVLTAVDTANAYVLDRYRPIDIVVKSWRIDSTDRVKRTQLEKKLNVFWDKTKNDGNHREWCRDRPPSFSITAAGMEYFPEYGCSLDIQHAANVNDDMHISPSDLEYMVPALLVMALEDAGLTAHVTCGTCVTTEGLLAMLDADFDKKTDEKIKERLYSYVGTDSDPDWAVNQAFDRIASIANAIPGRSLAVVDLLDRILRRVNAFDSTNDEVLKKWAGRMINVGSFVRAWNTKKDVLNGVIPVLQADYKASRTAMQQKAKLYADIDPKKSEFNKVGEKTAKLSMNRVYGLFSLRTNQSRKSVGVSSSAETGRGEREGGVGGGTRHAPSANQITSVSRCVFGNIACAIQQALPNTKQVYGDTDSVFCNHNIPGDGGGRSLFVREGDGRLVYRIDTIMKNKIANILPLFINAATKGIKFDEKRDAGVPFMKIAHERLAFLVFLFAKKTYHMIHLKEGSKGSDAILECKGEESSSIDKFTRVIDCPKVYRDYVIAHNPSLILAAAKNDEKLNDFLRKEGATDRESLKVWFTTSDRWLEIDADMLYSMYASRMLDVENGNWIDWRTSRLIERGTELYEGVTQAAEAFTLYKKGAFVKKGIPSSTKLKSLQSLFIRNLPKHLFDRASEYRNCIGHHAQNCASFEASPFMSITSSRVNKYKTDEKQKLPNPMAMALNNHIHPNNPILPAEKFLTVTVASAWAISGDKSHGSVPTGYFNNKSVKWDAEMMRGLVAGSVVKSLSVVPNTIRTVMEMVRSDAKNIESVIEECVDTLTTASTGTSGFSLKKRALCFNSGILCSDTLVRAVLSGKAAASAWCAGSYEEEKEATDVDEENNIEAEEGLMIPAAKKSSAKISLEKIRERILNCMIYDDVLFNKNVDPNTLDLKELICNKLRLDDRVYEQLCDLVDQLTTSKDMMTKKRVGKERVSALDEMIAAVEIDFDKVIDICADRIVQHCKKCPVIMPDHKNDHLFKKVLDLLVGKVKCTATCVNAACQSLDFVQVCTLALREVNRRRRTDEFDVSIANYNTKEMVKAAFGPRFNRELDAVVFLFDEPAAPMSKARIDKRIRDGATSLTTGAVYNPDDGRFFGGLMDRDAMIEESLLQRGSVVELPFVTGIYYREAVELAVSRLCENRSLRELLEK